MIDLFAQICKWRLCTYQTLLITRERPFHEQIWTSSSKKPKWSIAKKMLTKFFLFFIAGRRRVSLRRSPQLNQRSPSASSHYFNLCRLGLVIPVVLLLLLSTIIDVTGELWPADPSTSDILRWPQCVEFLLLIREHRTMIGTIWRASLNISITFRPVWGRKEVFAHHVE